MSFSPEALSRINKIKKMAHDLKDVSHNDPKVHDFLRNGQGSGDIIWLINLLMSNKSDESIILSQLRELAKVKTNGELVNKIKQVKDKEARNVIHDNYTMTFGNDNDDELDYYDDHDPELDGYEEDEN